METENVLWLFEIAAVFHADNINYIHVSSHIGSYLGVNYVIYLMGLSISLCAYLLQFRDNLYVFIYLFLKFSYRLRPYYYSIKIMLILFCVWSYFVQTHAIRLKHEIKYDSVLQIVFNFTL